MGEHKYTAIPGAGFVVTKGDDKTPLHTFPNEGEAALQVKFLDEQEAEAKKAEKAKPAGKDDDDDDEPKTQAKPHVGPAARHR
jgi:hypothetical protein